MLLDSKIPIEKVFRTPQNPLSSPGFGDVQYAFWSFLDFAHV